MNCFRFFDFKSFDEVDRITIPEYNLLMKAEKLKRVDHNYWAHQQAYLNFAVQATKGNKKQHPVYKTFKSFFDYEKEERKALGEKEKTESRFVGLSKLIKRGGS